MLHKERREKISEIILFKAQLVSVLWQCTVDRKNGAIELLHRVVVKYGCF